MRLRLGYSASVLSIILTVLLCRCSPEKQEFTFNWKDGKAVSLNLPSRLAGDVSAIQIMLGVDNATPMLGEFMQEGDQFMFVPVVPFTRGMHYHILLNGKIIGEINVPVDTNAKNPELSIYPSSDTLPVNLLKMYFVFTEPMVEGQSLRHIHLLNQQGDTLNGTFLDLQPELWNTEGTMLTLWLDPGRIKRDLIPNKEMGNPLQKGNMYTLQVSEQWKSKAAMPMQQRYSKSFVAHGRDEEVPDVALWNLTPPASDTTSLTIYFPEPMDYSLIQSAIRVVDEKGETVMGQIRVMSKERGIAFTPKDVWMKGTYRLQVESRLEDLAGNNLARPFDRDLNKTAESKEKPFYEREFEFK